MRGRQWHAGIIGKKNNYYKRPWKPNYQSWIGSSYRRGYRPSYRRYDFFDDFEGFDNDFYQRKPKVEKIAEFKVKPFFDQIFPRYSIRLETKTYFGYLSLKLRNDALAHLEPVVRLIEEIFCASVVNICMTCDSGEKYQLYERTESSVLPDPAKVAFAKMLVNKRDVVRFPLSRVVQPNWADWRKKVDKLEDYFSDTLGNGLGEFFIYHSSRPEKLIRITKGSHFDPVAPTFQERESGLESFLEKALVSNHINYEKQKKIVFNNQVLTIPDFSISGTRILIYCDGFAYHSSSQKMNVDRKQDRILQNLGYMVLRFTDSEIENDIQAVIHEIAETIRMEASKRPSGQ